ncbi:MAG: hypothetical protein AVDCRST_MAG54-874, partial [uncultured Actinomycetospora sp.]
AGPGGGLQRRSRRVLGARRAARAPGRARRVGGAGRGRRRAGRAPRGVRGGRAADLGHRHPGRRRWWHSARGHARPVGHPLDQRRARLRHPVPRAGRRRRRARHAGRPAGPDLQHRRAGADPGGREHPAHRRPDRRRGHADLDHLRRAGHRPRRRRAPGVGGHLGAHRGLVPLDVRRAAQLAAQGVLEARHAGLRERAALRRRQRRGALRRRGPVVLVHRRPRPARPRRRQRPHPRAVPGRAGAAQHAGLVRPRRLPDAVRRARRVREARGQADALRHVGRARRRHAGLLRPEPAAGRAHLQQRRVRARQPRHRPPAGPQQRLARLREPVPGQRAVLLQLGADGRPGGDRRLEPPADHPRRRHRRLDHPVGGVPAGLGAGVGL